MTTLCVRKCLRVPGSVAALLISVIVGAIICDFTFIDLSSRVILGLGAGASLPASIYEREAELFQCQASTNVPAEIQYTSVGTGAGQQKILNNEVDFAGIDVALTPQQLVQAVVAESDMVVHPARFRSMPIISATVGGKATKVNMAMRMETLIAIYLGNITMWNDEGYWSTTRTWWPCCRRNASLWSRAWTVQARRRYTHVHCHSIVKVLRESLKREECRLAKRACS